MLECISNDTEKRDLLDAMRARSKALNQRTSKLLLPMTAAEVQQLYQMYQSCSGDALVDVMKEVDRLRDVEGDLVCVSYSTYIQPDIP